MNKRYDTDVPIYLYINHKIIFVFPYVFFFTRDVLHITLDWVFVPYIPSGRLLAMDGPREQLDQSEAQRTDL